MNYNDFENFKMYLTDIKNYILSYLYYLNNQNNELDKNEIDMYISTIPEIVDDLINKLERIWINYETEKEEQ